jgi:hypothetical protein
VVQSEQRERIGTYLILCRVRTYLGDQRTINGEEGVVAEEQLRFSDESHVVADVVLCIAGDLIEVIRRVLGCKVPSGFVYGTSRRTTSADVPIRLEERR